jgi:hypothetical protein
MTIWSVNYEMVQRGEKAHIFLAARGGALPDKGHHFCCVSGQRRPAQWVTAPAWNMGEVVRRAKIEAAQADDIDGAMSGVHWPELPRGDPVLQQDFDPAIERRHSYLANVRASALNALQHKDNGGQGVLRHFDEQSLDKVQQSVRGVEVLVERLIDRLAQWLVGPHENRLIEPFFALEVMKNQPLDHICPRRNALRSRCSKTVCGELNLCRVQNGRDGHLSVARLCAMRSVLGSGCVSHGIP